jgi:hypothetical protein
MSTTPPPSDGANTTPALEAKWKLRKAWFEVHVPTYTVHEARADVERLFVAIEDEAGRAAAERAVTPLVAALEIIAAPSTNAPDAIGVTARNIARVALAGAAPETGEDR